MSDAQRVYHHRIEVVNAGNVANNQLSWPPSILLQSHAAPLLQPNLPDLTLINALMANPLIALFN